MSAMYSDTPIHIFIKEYIESEGGIVKDVCDDYFTIKTATLLEPLKYTYKPAIAHERKINLIATGSPSFNSIVEMCLKKGTVSSICLKNQIQVEKIISSAFKDYDYHCELCEKITTKGIDKYICTKSPKCYHKINNAKISKIEIIENKKTKIMLFLYNVFINNKLKRNEELVYVIIDENGNKINEDILNNSLLTFSDSEDRISLDLFDKCNIMSNEILDQIIKDKTHIFNLQLKKEISYKLGALEKKLDDEILQKSISKKWEFDEKEWITKKNIILTKEQESLNTFVSVKLLNFLLINTNRIFFKVLLDNGSKIEGSLILGAQNNAVVLCPECNKGISEGFATEDGKYVCFSCLNQSIETKKLYSKHFKLNKDSTTLENLEIDGGFKCSVCNKQNSNIFEFNCAYDQSKLCYSCFDFCSKCDKLFSINNLKKSKASKKLYCPTHIKKCESCYNLVGVDELRICNASGLKACSCTEFFKCVLCEQEYSTNTLENGKCPGCNSLKENLDQKMISPIILYNSKFENIKKWMKGDNALNSVIIAKGIFSDTLFVLQKEKVVYEKKINLLEKMKGY